MGAGDKFNKYDAVVVAGEGEDSHSVLRQHKALLKIKGKFVIQHHLAGIAAPEPARRRFTHADEDPTIVERPSPPGKDSN